MGRQEALEIENILNLPYSGGLYQIRQLRDRCCGSGHAPLMTSLGSSDDVNLLEA